MAKIRLGARQGQIVRYVALHPRETSREITDGLGWSCSPVEVTRRLDFLWRTDVLHRWVSPKGFSAWTVTDAGREWLATRANPVVVPVPPKRRVIGRRMRLAAQYVATHEGCTKYAAGKAVARPGHPRDGWAIVQRAIDAGLITVRKRRDGTTALSVPGNGGRS